jgi:hypothetical protein
MEQQPSWHGEDVQAVRAHLHYLAVQQRIADLWYMYLRAETSEGRAALRAALIQQGVPEAEFDALTGEMSGCAGKPACAAGYVHSTFYEGRHVHTGCYYWSCHNQWPGRGYSSNVLYHAWLRSGRLHRLRVLVQGWWLSTIWDKLKK